MNFLKSNLWLGLISYLTFPAVIAGTVQIGLTPSYVAIRGQNGDIEIVVTVAANRHMTNNGAVAASIPMGSFLDQAANKECRNGYVIKSQGSEKMQMTLNVINWTQRTVIQCHDA